MPSRAISQTVKNSLSPNGSASTNVPIVPASSRPSARTTQRFTLCWEGFTSLCHAYIDVHPSRSFSLRWLGQNMASFLSDADYPAHLAELTRFEWALVEAFDAADAVVAKEAELTTITAFSSFHANSLLPVERPRPMACR